MAWCTRINAAIVALAVASACGQDPGLPKRKGEPAAIPTGGSSEVLPEFAAVNHTPGYFRETHRILSAQSLIGDGEAVNRLLLHLPERIEAPGELPAMLPKSISALEGVLVLAYRGTQATAGNASIARHIGEALLSHTLRLDPARPAYNAEHPGLPPVPHDLGGPKTIANATLYALEYAAADGPADCQPMNVELRAAFQPHAAELSYIPERCEPDRHVGGYCEPDEYFEGECYSDWIPEECSGGYYEDDGYYQYYCYSSDDCRYVWRPKKRYVGGSCYGGYYEEYCESDYYEPGICYEGTFVPGHCIPGRWEYRYSGGTWSWPSYLTEGGAEGGTIDSCFAVWPHQRAILETALRLLAGELREHYDPYYRTMIDTLLEQGGSQTDRAFVDGALQAIENVAADDWTPDDSAPLPENN